MHLGVHRTSTRALFRARISLGDPNRRGCDGSMTARIAEDRLLKHPPYSDGGKYDIPRAPRTAPAGSKTDRESGSTVEVERNKFTRDRSLYWRRWVAGRPCPHRAKHGARGRPTSHSGVDADDRKLRHRVRPYSAPGRWHEPPSAGAGHFASTRRSRIGKPPQVNRRVDASCGIFRVNGWQRVRLLDMSHLRTCHVRVPLSDTRAAEVHRVQEL